MNKNAPLNLLNFEQMLEKTSEIIQVIDGQGNFLYINKAWTETLGYDEDELQRLHFTDIFVSQPKGEQETFIKQVMSGKSYKDVDLMFLSKTRKQIPVKGNIFSIFDKEEQVIKVIGMFKDVSLRSDFAHHAGTDPWPFARRGIAHHQ